MQELQNPYNLSFGKIPQQYISRSVQLDQIITTFEMEQPVSQVYMLTGVRGAGKTVVLTEVSEHFSKSADWIVLNLSSDTDILKSAVDKLTNKSFLKKYLPDVDINVSVFGVSIAHKDNDFDADTVLRNYLEDLLKRNKKVLFVIDEMVKNEYTKLFASNFQIYLREGYPVYLLMAGLYENISNLQNEKTLTFLYRAPKVTLEPLNIPAITANYKEVFGFSTEKAIKMARLTKGYPFAFQTLGYLMWKNKGESEKKILSEYDTYLSSYVYDKIWSELSIKDRKVVAVIAQGITKTAEIRKHFNISAQLLNVYRKRLSDQGIVSVTVHGSVTLALPRFENYIQVFGVIDEDL